ncbi:xanthine dehydrogenase small subunit [Sinobacterium caligoides]|uniref:Xanthine dehydrogenase small subunit n=1 Tax=Sinobacterium caligoides TaxID=933926 RepID=A0A3N2E240_9GAMM|nr:xanthine dehydrogenase small subunit [Sinobacterium caligoides]ROS05635.1 xanthine dehydrogenase small subunit [Sinobacterium caligoides]
MIRFLLNDQPHAIDNCDPNMTVLEYLRNELKENSSKEGCASGDCGACTVVLAELVDDELNYRTANSCITFVGNLHGKQLITAAHLKEQDKLHPVQQAMVDKHGSQCGFCTPGIVMSLFALQKRSDHYERGETLEALSGNLCRCTGYRPIMDAAVQMYEPAEDDQFTRNAEHTKKSLNKINGDADEVVTLSNGEHHYYAPATLQQAVELIASHPKARLVRGGTDLALEVTQHLRTIPEMIDLSRVKELNKLTVTDTEIVIGGARSLDSSVETLKNYYPEFADMLARFAAKQVRQQGSFGGNIGNASPIGDTPPVLLALNANLTLKSASHCRDVALEDFFTDYRQTLLKSDELIGDILIPLPEENAHLKVYKISKRQDDDISAVLAAFNLSVVDGVISKASLGFGGMAATPKRAKATEAALIGQPFNQATIDNAKQQLAVDFQPLSDMRASSEYRLEVSRNLLQKAFIEIGLELQQENDSPLFVDATQTRICSHA